MPFWVFVQGRNANTQTQPADLAVDKDKGHSLIGSERDLASPSSCVCVCVCVVMCVDRMESNRIQEVRGGKKRGKSSEGSRERARGTSGRVNKCGG